MKREKFIKLAMMGLSSGLLIANDIEASEEGGGSSAQKESKGCGGMSGCGGSGHDYEEDNGNIGFHILSEEELLLQLSEKGEKLYMSLSDSGKELARKVASQRCNGTNECKGLNACKTEEHACAGHGACKGLSKCGFSDKNLAVKVVWRKMNKSTE